MEKWFWAILAGGALLQTRWAHPYIATASYERPSFDFVAYVKSSQFPKPDLVVWMNDPCVENEAVLISISQDGKTRYINPERPWESLPSGLFFWRGANNDGKKPVTFSTGKGLLQKKVQESAVNSSAWTWDKDKKDYQNLSYGTWSSHIYGKSGRSRPVNAVFAPHPSACTQQFMLHLQRLPSLNFYDFFMVPANFGKQINLPQVPSHQETRNNCPAGSKSKCPQIQQVTTTPIRAAPVQTKKQ